MHGCEIFFFHRIISFCRKCELIFFFISECLIFLLFADENFVSQCLKIFSLHRAMRFGSRFDYVGVERLHSETARRLVPCASHEQQSQRESRGSPRGALQIHGEKKCTGSTLELCSNPVSIFPRIRRVAVSPVPRDSAKFPMTVPRAFTPSIYPVSIQYFFHRLPFISNERRNYIGTILLKLHYRWKINWIIILLAKHNIGWIRYIFIER